jgi:hypothetical protein
MQIENIKKLLIKLDDSIFPDFPVKWEVLGTRIYVCTFTHVCTYRQYLY